MKKLLKIILPIILLSSCFLGVEDESKNEVKIWLFTDPDNLNPLLSQTSSASDVKATIFQSLLAIHHEEYVLTPLLAKNVPEVNKVHDSLYQIKFLLREDIQWSDGSKFELEDILFTFKLIVCPTLPNEIQSYGYAVENLQNIVINKDENSIQFNCSMANIRTLYDIGYEVPIIPRKVFDPQNTMDKFSFEELKTNSDLINNKDLLDFAELFTSPEYASDPEYLIGSGPYKLTSWERGLQLKLTKTQNWWGLNHADEGYLFSQYPDSLIYILIPEVANAANAVQANELDIAKGITVEYLEEIQNNPLLVSSNEPTFSYSNIALNNKREFLDNREFRKALNYLTDIQTMIRVVLKDQAIQTIGPVPVGDKQRYNNNIVPYSYQPSKAKEIFQSLGLQDADGDGYLDNENGEPITLEFVYNSSNSIREQVGLLLKNSFEKNGIQLKLNGLSIDAYRGKVRAKDFDLIYYNLSGDPGPLDFSFLFSSNPAKAPFNFGNYSSTKMDSLLSLYENTLNIEFSNKLVHEMQATLHEEAPMIFLWTSNVLICTQKKFKKTVISAHKPGYWAPAFKE